MYDVDWLSLGYKKILKTTVKNTRGKKGQSLLLAPFEVNHLQSVLLWVG
jgi:hypothetical protein